MKLRLYAFGRAPRWVADGVVAYASRMPHLSIESISRNPRETQEKRMLRRVDERSLYVVLDPRGNLYSSMEFARTYENWRCSGKDISLLIGDSDGFSNEMRERANIVWSLSRLTFPHDLVQIAVCEQLYRAHTIITGHPYHRA